MYRVQIASESRTTQARARAYTIALISRFLGTTSPSSAVRGLSHNALGAQTPARLMSVWFSVLDIRLDYQIVGQNGTCFETENLGFEACTEEGSEMIVIENVTCLLC